MAFTPYATYSSSDSSSIINPCFLVGQFFCNNNSHPWVFHAFNELTHLEGDYTVFVQGWGITSVATAVQKSTRGYLPPIYLTAAANNTF